jgi:uncharacterized protein YcfJ
MNIFLKTTVALAAGLLALSAGAQITFYENDDFRGRAFRATRAVANLGTQGFNDRASSVVVQSGRWEVCQDTAYRGDCVVLRPGSYASLRDMGLNDRLSSTRRSDQRRAVPDAPAPRPATPYAWRQRPEERLYNAPVNSARAVMGPPTERCWVERQQVVTSDHHDASAGRGLLGAVIGGVIGHQIGGGSGRDLATAGGAVAGAVIGANSGRDSHGDRVARRDVRRCSSVPATTPAYWDVGYRFRGVQHQAQMTTEPGDTVRVNRAGEPRQ